MSINIAHDLDHQPHARPTAQSVAEAFALASEQHAEVLLFSAISANFLAASNQAISLTTESL